MYTLYQKENQVIRYSELHVNVCYNLQPVHKKLTLCVQWNSILFQTGSARCSGRTPH